MMTFEDISMGTSICIFFILVTTSFMYGFYTLFFTLIGLPLYKLNKKYFYFYYTLFSFIFLTKVALT